MDRLTPQDLADLVALRQDLHRAPELSGHETYTATRIAQTLRQMGVDEVITGLGGHGVAGVIAGALPGPTVLLRCELDALPIQETGSAPYRSARPGVAHLCGHDGHMATLIGVGRMVLRVRPTRGRVVLMFQPAEEDGSGAIAVCDDPRFAPLAPDWAFALHNLPEIPRGQAHVPDGLASAPSVGVRIGLSGTEAHACAPETGRSPAAALAQLMADLPGLSQGDFPEDGYRLVTLTHLRLGQPAFGIAPGDGEVRVTLRSSSDGDLGALLRQVEAQAKAVADGAGLRVDLSRHDPFLAGINDPEAAAMLRAAGGAVGLQVSPGQPLRASEDFGRFGHDCRAAMLLLGAGPGPALHNPDYDFDDRLIAPGAALLTHAARTALACEDVSRAKHFT